MVVGPLVLRAPGQLLHVTALVLLLLLLMLIMLVVLWSCCCCYGNQQYLDGDEVDCDLVMWDGQCTYGAVTGGVSHSVSHTVSQGM